jgi:ankyrin repeat protein
MFLGVMFMFCVNCSRSREFHEAVKKDDLGKVKILLAKDTRLANDRDQQSKLKSSPLQEAAARGNLKMVELLLGSGADPNGRDQGGTTALVYAAANGRKEACELLLEKGADVNARDGLKSTALFYAADLGHLEVCELLLAKGVDANAQDKEGVTALVWATRHRQLGAIRLLVDHGADIKLGLQPGKWSSPLHLAATNNDEALARRLIELGADLNFPDAFGNTPLHAAASFLNYDLAKLLLEKGADIEARDNKDSSPIDVVGVMVLARNGVLSAQDEDTRNKIISLLAANGGKDDPAKRARSLAIWLGWELKINLDSLSFRQSSYQKKNQQFALTFKELGWKPMIQDVHYAYFMGQDVIQPQLGGPYQLPPGIKAEVSAKGFVIFAVGNIDDDPTLDVWTINEKNELKHLVDDTGK